MSIHQQVHFFLNLKLTIIYLKRMQPQIQVHHHCYILCCFPRKWWIYKMTNIPGISDKSKQQLLLITL